MGALGGAKPICGAPDCGCELIGAGYGYCDDIAIFTPFLSIYFTTIQTNIIF
jgi:hypothetical protein